MKPTDGRFSPCKGCRELVPLGETDAVQRAAGEREKKAYEM